jgi:regulator of cell morphogenesis and NO signaling
MTGSRKMNEVGHISVADIALNFPQSIKILNRYQLDYCCHGRHTFVQACAHARVDPDRVWGEIEMELPIPGPGLGHRFSTWDAPILLDFIVQNHHAFIRMQLPHLRQLISETAKRHGRNFPELLEVKETFAMLADQMLGHIDREELVVFPAIRRITSRDIPLITVPLLPNLQQPIAALERDHDHGVELIKLIRTFTGHYRSPVPTDPTLELTYKLLEEFDEDVTQHIHLENNVLFPKVKI